MKLNNIYRRKQPKFQLYDPYSIKNPWAYRKKYVNQCKFIFF